MVKPYNIDHIDGLIYRLSFRIGFLRGNGFFWRKKDIALLVEARDELQSMVDHIRASSICGEG